MDGGAINQAAALVNGVLLGDGVSAPVSLVVISQPVATPESGSYG